MFATSQHAHFIGIGGIGMSGIAEILLNQKMKVSGSDLRRSPITDRLAQLGAIVYEGHEAGPRGGRHGGGHQLRRQPRTIPRCVEAHARKIPVIQRAEMLAELMRLKYGIAIAGMHGKTTTTSMVASVLAAGGLDPTVVVGGRVDAWAPTPASAPRNTWWPRPTRATAPSSSSRPSSPWSPTSTASTWTATATWTTWSAPSWPSWTRCRSTAR